MNRRKFIVATGSTTIGAGVLNRLTQQPSLAINGDIGIGEHVQYTIRKDGDELGELQLTLNSVEIETNNIDIDEVDVTITYTKDGDEDIIIEDENVPDDNTSYKLADIDSLAPDNDGDNKEYDFNVTIKVNHDDVPPQKLEDDFTFELIKEIIEDIKFITTDDKITFDEDDEDIEETDDNVYEGIIQTEVIDEMTTLGE